MGGGIALPLAKVELYQYWSSTGVNTVSALDQKCITSVSVVYQSCISSVSVVYQQCIISVSSVYQ